MVSGSERRSYVSVRRREQADQTRRAIVDAARELFLESGWAATAVRDVARAADVSAPTVYAKFGNKAGLTRALVDEAGLLADIPRMLDDLESAADPGDQITAMVAFDRRLFERSGDVLMLIRDAARVDEEIADIYHQVRAEADETRARVFSDWSPGALCEELSLAEAVDAYAAMCSIDVFRELTRERVWPPERVEFWWAESLRRSLLSSDG